MTRESVLNPILNSERQLGLSMLFGHSNINIHVYVIVCLLFLRLTGGISNRVGGKLQFILQKKNCPVPRSGSVA